MRIASQWASAAGRVVASMRSRHPCRRSSEMSSMYELPRRRASILRTSTSTAVTSRPSSAKATASGRPTYPIPTMPTLIAGRLDRLRARPRPPATDTPRDRAARTGIGSASARAIATGSSGPTTTPVRVCRTTRAASLSDATATIGRSAPRYSKSLPVTTERCGPVASSSRASASACSCRASAFGNAPTTSTRPAGAVASSARSASVRPPASTSRTFESSGSSDSAAISPRGSRRSGCDRPPVWTMSKRVPCGMCGPDPFGDGDREVVAGQAEALVRRRRGSVAKGRGRRAPGGTRAAPALRRAGPAPASATYRAAARSATRPPGRRPETRGQAPCLGRGSGGWSPGGRW